MNQSFELFIVGSTLFLLFLLVDFIVPIVIDKPSFAFTTWIGRMVDTRVITPAIRCVLINYYTYRYKQEERNLSRAIRKFITAPRNEKWYWREIASASARQRASMFNKLCEVRNVYPS